MSLGKIIADIGASILRLFSSNDYASKYATMYKTCSLRQDKLTELDYCINKIEAGRGRYIKVADKVGNGLQWWVIGLIHLMEGGCNFKTHLHNGDSLNARTVNVPKGRPKTGVPPFTWEDSAFDALTYTGLASYTNWTIGNILDRLEKYNGLGYRNRGVASPYLWSYTNWYSKGKYTSDGKFDANAISKQPGVAAIMKRWGKV